MQTTSRYQNGWPGNNDYNILFFSFVDDLKTVTIYFIKHTINTYIWRIEIENSVYRVCRGTL